MRILMVLHQFFPEFSGGTERVALNLARAAQRAGHYVQILACQVDIDQPGGSGCKHLIGARRMVYQGVPVTLLPKVMLPALADFSLEVDPPLVKRVSDWMKYERFEVCHVMHTMRMSTAVLAAQHAGLPLLLTLTDFFLACPRINLVDLDNQICDGPNLGKKCGENCLTAPWSQTTLMNRYNDARALLASVSVRVAPSEFVANRFRAAFPGCEFRVIPHGIDVLTLSSAVGHGIRPDYQKRSDKFRLGYVGGIIPQKGLDILLQALALVELPDVELMVVGGFHGAPAYHHDVLALGKADPRVKFMGHLEQGDVFELMQTFDLLCLPSRVPETFSLVLHEAAALGIPALVSNLGAPAGKVLDTGCGEVIASNAVDEWANTLREIAQNSNKLEQWQANLPLPTRVEEEGFFYDSLYRTLLR